jgi:hypothetical protein
MVKFINFKIQITMVVLHYKKTDLNQFLFETHCSIKTEDLLNELCERKCASNQKIFNLSSLPLGSVRSF